VKLPALPATSVAIWGRQAEQLAARSPRSPKALLGGQAKAPRDGSVQSASKIPQPEAVGSTSGRI